MIKLRTVFGIDVSKHTINLAIVVIKVKVDECKLTLDRPGLADLLKLLKSFHQPEVVFEATGIYSRILQHFLDCDEFEYTMLNPLAAKKQLDNLRPYKSDRSDALNLAQTSFIIHRSLSYKQSPIYEQLHDLSRFYQEVSRNVISHKNRLHRALQLTFPQLESLFSNTNNELYWAIVQHFACPSQVFNTSFTELYSFILNSTNKIISANRANRIAKKLLVLAKKAYPVVDDNSYVYEQIRYLANRIMKEVHEKDKIITEMHHKAENLPEYNLLLSIPGFGVRTVTSLIGELGDIRRFHSSNALNAYIGIDLRHYESGNFVAADHISKRGDAVARKILFRSIQNIAVASHFHLNHINDFYQKRKRQSSQPGTKKIAIAAIHRLLRTIYHLVKYNQSYNYQIAKS
ncbi:transposase [Limosilactobacillus panis DSM 6035]|uniref:Transposase n=1 Tax=Limosilactobacillus panis DSM 6035 TaxID=1423782 RepID=A0A0R1XG35_9LACO|nr:IS110 family transposase [Limosilactobacillus panis]KRM26937.1 transposase [Limosilactobacillus panis DSM 6035]